MTFYKYMSAVNQKLRCSLSSSLFLKLWQQIGQREGEGD